MPGPRVYGGHSGGRNISRPYPAAKGDEQRP